MQPTSTPIKDLLETRDAIKTLLVPGHALSAKPDQICVLKVCLAQINRELAERTLHTNVTQDINGDWHYRAYTIVKGEVNNIVYGQAPTREKARAALSNAKVQFVLQFGEVK